MFAKFSSLCYNKSGGNHMKQKECLLYDGKLCDGCGECDRCDLDPQKICDNCMKCMGDEVDFRAIAIAGIRLENEIDAGK